MDEISRGQDPAETIACGASTVRQTRCGKSYKATGAITGTPRAGRCGEIATTRGDWAGRRDLVPAVDHHLQTRVDVRVARRRAIKRRLGVRRVGGSGDRIVCVPLVDVARRGQAVGALAQLSAD